MLESLYRYEMEQQMIVGHRTTSLCVFYTKWINEKKEEEMFKNPPARSKT